MELSLRSVKCHRGHRGVNLTCTFYRLINRQQKVNRLLYRPEQALGVPGQSVHEGGILVSPTHSPLLRPERYSWYSCLDHNAARRISLINNYYMIGIRTPTSDLQRSASTNCATACPE
jgi:hypothetical protein